MDELKKAKVVTAVSGVAAAGVLTAAICAFAFTPGARADTPASASDVGGGNTISIEVDPEIYDGVMAMLRYYKDLEAPTQSEAGEPVDAEIVKAGDSYCIILDGEAHDLAGEGVEIVETADGLYVIVDGKLYRLVLPKGAEGSVEDVLNPGGSDEAPETLGVDDNGKPIVAYDEDGRPIIGYDEDGNPIYGYSNPRIRVDANGIKYYHIVWGDTLCKISSDVHISVDELADYNRIRNVNLIYAESDLRLPDRLGEWTEEDLAEAERLEAEAKAEKENPNTGAGGE